MFTGVLSTASAIQMILSSGTLALLLLSSLRSARINRDDIERGGMRSMSWPAANRN